MLEALELLEKEVERITKLAVVLRQTGLTLRAEYRQKEAERFQAICDLLETEYLDNES